jgi:hypothetical protein
MVRRGSTVRVRQRASSFYLLSLCSRCLGWQRRRPRSVHQGPPWPLSRAEIVQQTDRMFASVAWEVAVVAVDHGQAGAHVAGQIEGGDACTEREGREGVPEIVDPARRAYRSRHREGSGTLGAPPRLPRRATGAGATCSGACRARCAASRHANRVSRQWLDRRDVRSGCASNGSHNEPASR